MEVCVCHGFMMTVTDLRGEAESRWVTHTPAVLQVLGDDEYPEAATGWPVLQRTSPCLGTLSLAGRQDPSVWQGREGVCACRGIFTVLLRGEILHV